MALLEDNSGRTAPRNMLWNSYVPPKVSFFHGKLDGEKHFLRCTLKRGVFRWLANVPCEVKLMRG